MIKYNVVVMVTGIQCIITVVVCVGETLIPQYSSDTCVPQSINVTVLQRLTHSCCVDRSRRMGNRSTDGTGSIYTFF